MSEDPGDHRRGLDAGDPLDGPATGRAGVQIDLEHALEALRSAHGGVLLGRGAIVTMIDRTRVMAYRQRMSIAHSKITAQGQISVPREVRRRLAVGPGSILEWEQDGDRMVVRKAGRFSSADIHAAIFATPPKPRTLGELKAGIARHLKAKHARG